MMLSLLLESFDLHPDLDGDDRMLLVLILARFDL